MNFFETVVNVISCLLFGGKKKRPKKMFSDWNIFCNIRYDAIITIFFSHKYLTNCTMEAGLLSIHICLFYHNNSQKGTYLRIFRMII